MERSQHPARGSATLSIHSPIQRSETALDDLEPFRESWTRMPLDSRPYEPFEEPILRGRTMSTATVPRSS